MPTPADILKEIHRLRRYATDLQKKIDQFPRKLETLKGVVEHQEKIFTEEQAAVKQLKVKGHEDDVTLKAVIEQTEKYQKQLNQIMSKKEFDALQHEIAHGKEKIDHQEDHLLQIWNEIEERTANLPALDKNVKDARQELAELEKEAQARTAELSAELEKVKKELAETETSIPEGDLRVQYERLIRQRGDDSFSPVKKKTCQSCYIEVTGQMYNELQMGWFTICRNCGRILYLAE